MFAGLSGVLEEQVLGRTSRNVSQMCPQDWPIKKASKSAVISKRKIEEVTFPTAGSRTMSPQLS